MTAVNGSTAYAPPTYIDDGPAATSSGSGPPSLLPMPFALAGGDIGADLAALEVQSGKTERSEASTERDADEAIAQSEANQEVQSLRSEASSMTDQAWTDGALALFQGAAGGKGTTVGAVLGGVKGTTDGLYGADQKNDEASAKGFEAAASEAQNAVADAHDAETDANQLIQSALDFYKEYVATQAQTDGVAAGRS